jgi:hypothetical protein
MDEGIKTKIKHVVYLQRLFNDTKSGGFSKKDLGPSIIRSDSMLKMIFPTRGENDEYPIDEPWNPCFKWQVEEFPVARDIYADYEHFGEVVNHETILAIAKDSEFCAVITISSDLKYIWYRMYKNDVHIPGIFGSLMYAYTQSDQDLHCRCIFTLFNPVQTAKYHRQAELPRWGPPYITIYMESQKYVGVYNKDAEIRNFDLHTYGASSVHKLDHRGIHFHTDALTDLISFKDSRSALGGFSDPDNPSENHYKSDPDPRYPHLLQYEGPRNYLAGTARHAESHARWFLDPRTLIGDCMLRPTQQTPWILASDALATEITRSVIRALYMDII